jgi:hypothetical protein
MAIHVPFAGHVELKEHLPWLLHLLLLSECAVAAGSCQAPTENLSAEAGAQSSNSSACGNDESATERSASTTCAARMVPEQGRCPAGSGQLPDGGRGLRRDSAGFSLVSTSCPDSEVMHVFLDIIVTVFSQP